MRQAWLTPRSAPAPLPRLVYSHRERVSTAGNLCLREQVTRERGWELGGRGRARRRKDVWIRLALPRNSGQHRSMSLSFPGGKMNGLDQIGQ